MIFTLKIHTNAASNMTGLIPEDLEIMEDLRIRKERGYGEIVVSELKNLDPQINRKYFQLIKIFTNSEFSIPEPLERFLGIDTIVDKQRRIDDCREAIMYHIGYRTKSIIRIDGQLIRGETGMSLQKVQNPEEHQLIYGLTRDWIFANLRKYGWTDKDLHKAFRCLYAGIPKADHDKLFKK